jgi:uncharacterized protein (TIGR02145 family)
MNTKRITLIYTLILMGLVLIFSGSCKKDDNTDGPVYGENVTDVDGNVYHTVIIGKQTWMVENLRTIHLNDVGKTPIPNLIDPLAWSTSTSPAGCMYKNDLSNVSTYGVLYNWYAASNSKLCPTGWHVPTNAEWLVLISALGGENEAANKLKESGISHWSSPNSGVTNSSGYTALPCGYRNVQGEYLEMGIISYCWSSSEYNAYNAWGGWLAYNKSNVGSFNVSKNLGFSIRCVKNNAEVPAN